MVKALDGPRTPPSTGARARQLVIFCHGYGSNGADLMGLAPFLAQPVPGFPGAAYQWFGLANMDPHRLAMGVQAAAPSLDAFIDAELERYGLPASACALVGFSQGTMMAVHVGPRRREALGAVVGFSGLLAAPERLDAELKSRPPILLAHGDRDDRVPPQMLFAALEALAAARAPALWRLCPGEGHTIPQEALALAAEFLHDAFAGGFAGWTGPGARR